MTALSLQSKRQLFYKDIPPTIEIGHCDTSKILEELQKLTLDDWAFLTHVRHGEDKKTRKSHVSSFSIPVVWSSIMADPREPMKRLTVPRFSQFVELTQPVIQSVQMIYPNSRVLRIMFARMEPHTEVGRHIDMAFSNRACRRIHLPIVTNKDVLFYIDGTEQNYPVGQIFEINNTLEHGVCNNGEECRIHLIVDVLPVEFNASIQDIPWERREEVGI